MTSKIPQFLLDKPASQSFDAGKDKVRISFIEKGIKQVADVIKTGYIQWESASLDGVLQRVDAGVKVLFLLFYVVIISLEKEIMDELYLASFMLILVLISRLNIFNFYRKVVFLGFLFGFLIAAPSALNIIVDGEIIFPVIQLSRDYDLWVYHIPSEIGITKEGLNVVAMLTLRVVNSLSVAFLVLHTTPFPNIIKALKVMKVPDSFLMVITLSYKYIFIFAKTVEDMHRAKKSKLVRPVTNGDVRNWAAGRMGFIFIKTRIRCEEIFKAMLGRGFYEEVKLYESNKFSRYDIRAGGILLIFGIFFLWI